MGFFEFLFTLFTISIMPSTCSAVGCKVRFKKGVNLKSHKFPKNEEVRNKWVQAVNRENFQPTEYHRLCSRHFQPDDYFINPYGNKCLKQEAVPSVFLNRPYLKKKVSTAFNEEGSKFEEKINIVKPRNGTTFDQKPYPSQQRTVEEAFVDNLCVHLKTACLCQNVSNNFNKNPKQISLNLSSPSDPEKKIKGGSRTASDTFIDFNSSEDKNYYYLQIPKIKVLEVRKLGYQFEKLVKEVKHMKLPNSQWRIVIIIQNQKMVSVSFFKRTIPEKVVNISGKSSICDIIIDRKNIVLLGSPVYIYSIEDLEIMLDIVNEREPKSPIIGYL